MRFTASAGLWRRGLPCLLIMRRFLFACLVFSYFPLPAADWPQFLGPTRNGIASEDKALPESLPSTGPQVLWEHTLGTGQAGPSVAQGKVIIFHRQGSDAIVEALDVATGKQLWQFAYATNYRDAFGKDDGPRAMPTIANGTVFVHGAEGLLHAISLADGKLLWSVDTAKDFGSPPGWFGRACAPLVVDGKVILTPGGGTGKAVAAFDAKTGAVQWSAADDEASYASPVLASATMALCWLRNDLTTIEVVTGKVLHHENFRPAIDASVSAATPIKTDKGWFITAEYDVGASLWDVGNDGALSKTWSGDGAINCHYATPVYREGHVYGFDGRQEGGQTVRCWSTATHDVKWESPRVHGGTLLLVQDKLLIITEDGELWIVRASPDKFDQVATAQIMRAGHRSYAAYSNGVVYVRDREKLRALKLAE